MFKTFNLKKFLISIAIPIAVGLLAGFITKDAVDTYTIIEQPPLSPPSSVFPIVWTILYFMMGLALYGIANSRVPQEQKSFAYTIFGLQLLFNFIWPILFFNFGLYTFSAIWLGIMIVLIALCTYVFWKINKLSGYFMIPYLLWCIFALYLNIGVSILN